MGISTVQKCIILFSANAFTLREMTEILEKDSGNNAKECAKVAVQELLSLRTSSLSIYSVIIHTLCEYLLSYALFSRVEDEKAENIDGFHE